MLAIVSTSYRQVCRAYPSGGGAYVVAQENISQLAGLIAAAALLIDYVMTVAVSTASAVAQVYSVVPALYDLRIEIAIVVDRAHHDRRTSAACARPGSSSRARRTSSSGSRSS